MALKFSSREKHILYENRFCSQENVDIIFSGKQNDLTDTDVRCTFRIGYPEFKEIETLYSSSKHSFSDRTVCESNNIWSICSKKVLHKNTFKDVFIDSFSRYLDKNGQWFKLI